MRKSTLFISIALTTFMLAVLFGVVSEYKSIINSTPEAAAQPQPTVMAQAIVSAPIPTQVASITPEEAAAIAGKVIGRTDLYSVEGAQFEGVNAYLVTFSSGDLVYVGMDGQVLSISKIVVTVVDQGRHGGGGNGEEDSGGGNNGGDDDDHEGGDD